MLWLQASGLQGIGLQGVGCPKTRFATGRAASAGNYRRTGDHMMIETFDGRSRSGEPAPVETPSSSGIGERRETGYQRPRGKA
jgi:hypothetical protein